MKHTVITGCSFTEGTGLPDTKHNKSLWVNQLHASVDVLSKTKLLNLGKSAATNHEIFVQSVSAMTEVDCEYLFVAWTTLLRYRFALGVEIYPTEQFWSPSSEIFSVNVNPGITYNKQYLQDLRNKFLALHHDHYEIVKVLNYTAVINRLSQKLGVKVLFVNNILPWDQNYFVPVTNETRVPSDTTKYTQELLNLNTRNDQEYFVLYDKIHQEYQATGAFDNCVWLNLNHSFKNNFYLDQGTDNIHPGVQSHEAYGTFLAESFESASKKWQKF